MEQIYLDYAATTPIHHQVAQSMFDCLSSKSYFGNASSKHAYGEKALGLIDDARENVAKVISAASSEIIFTSGATEANNLAIRGLLLNWNSKKNHIVTTRTEHKSVIETCRSLAWDRYQTSFLRTDQAGLLDLNALEAAITDATALISICGVNNETGVIQELDKISEIAKNAGVLLHCDYAQGFGKVFLDVSKTHVDLLSFSSHKIYGPKGIGGLYVNDSIKNTLLPQITGGPQELGLRAGTLPTHQVVGFGNASQIIHSQADAMLAHLESLHAIVVSEVNNIPFAIVNGSLERKYPGIISISIPYVNFGELNDHLSSTYAFSKGSACNSDSIEPSHVLKGMGLKDSVALSSFRISFGSSTTEDEVRRFCVDLASAVEYIRARDLASACLIH